MRAKPLGLYVNRHLVVSDDGVYPLARLVSKSVCDKALHANAWLGFL